MFEEVTTQIRELVNEQIDAIDEKEGELPKVGDPGTLLNFQLTVVGYRASGRFRKLSVSVQSVEFREQSS